MFNFSSQDRILNAIRNLDYISSEKLGKELYDKLYALGNAVVSNKDEHINKMNITGIWYLADKHYDNEKNPQVIIRSSVKAGTKDRIALDYHVYQYIQNENAYDYDNDIIGENRFVEGLTKALRADILNRKVYTVYDASR